MREKMEVNVLDLKYPDRPRMNYYLREDGKFCPVTV